MAKAYYFVTAEGRRDGMVDWDEHVRNKFRIQCGVAGMTIIGPIIVEWQEMPEEFVERWYQSKLPYYASRDEFPWQPGDWKVIVQAETDPPYPPDDEEE